MSADKKQRIMQAAERMFKARQLHEITLDEVAREADVGKGTIYLYFTDKQDLFFQTAVAGFEEMCAMLRGNVNGQAPFRDELLTVCLKISEFFRHRRPLFRMIMAEGERAMGRGGSLRQRWLKRRKTMTQTVAAIVARGAAAGEVRRDIPAEVMTEYLLGMLRTRVTELEDTPESWRTHAALVDLFVNGSCCGRRTMNGRIEPKKAVSVKR